RYRKVCVPFGWQISARQAKVIATVVVISSFLFSTPVAIINGRFSRPTPRPGLYGHECTVDDAYVETIWPLVNSAWFILLFLGNCSTIVVLYSLLGARALGHSRAIGKSGEENGNADKMSKSNSMCHSRKISRDNSFLRKNRKFRETLTDTLSRARKSKALRKSSSASALKDGAKGGGSDPPKDDTKTSIKPKRSLNRTTVMLIIISAVYIVGFLPHLTLLVYFKMKPEEYQGLGSVGLSVYNLFLRSYFLNSAANALIYGICDLTFRHKCKSSIRKNCSCFKS
ncbi:hypothetical protein EGW08_015037, partial [Elysia chlorotica]